MSPGRGHPESLQIPAKERREISKSNEEKVLVPGQPGLALLTLAVVLSTTFLVVRSLLLPTRSLLTFSLA